MGKNYYYGGVFDTSRPDTFTANDQETPYFVYGNNKWVYIGENFAGYNLRRIQEEKGYPQDNGNWQIMVTDFKYLISEAVFSNFARLGSWIFNQDYQFSNQGSGDYASFDAGGRYYGKDSPDNNYIPNIVFNAQTGEGHFAGGNFAWDNQGQVFTRGGFRSPFVYVENEADYQNNFRDNILTESSVAYGWFTLPCSPAQSGRRVTVINHKLKSGDLTDRGTQIRLPNGYYFYEDGIKKTKLSFGRDGIELLGYGNETEFWGWIVLRRFYMETKRAYGHPLDILAMGRVCYLANWTFVGYTFDGRTLTVEDMSYVGDYFRIHLPSGWFNNSMQASGVFYPQVQVSGVNPDKPTIASIKEIRWNYIDIWYKDLQGNRPNGGGFSISIANRYAWEMLNFDDY